MKNLDKIDKIFSEGLHSYERQPSPQSWEKLEARLKKSKRKLWPIWLKYASVASVALLMSAGSYWLIQQKDRQNNLVAGTEKVVIMEEQPLPILQKTIPQLVKLEENNKSNANERKEYIAEKGANSQFIQQSDNQIIKVEAVKQMANLPLTDTKYIEKSTIVLVLQNTKPKVEEETIVLNMVETKQEAAAQTDLNDNNTKKETRLRKIWQQLKRAKNGETVNWSDIGVKPQKVLARADAKIENILTRDESSEK
jgi:hypothetical protein